MRITNKIITAKYTRSVNNLALELNRLNTQVASGRKFSRASENTSAAVKAFRLRNDMYKIDGYQENIAHAKAYLTNAESAVSHIEELMQTASEKILAAVNGTQSQSERKIIASEIRNLQAQLFQTLNSNSSGEYYFGGTNTDNRPFEIVDGKLQYNGYDLDLPLPAGTPAENSALVSSLRKDTQYVDIGLNVKFDEITGQIDGSTAFGYSIAGINIVGSGTIAVDGIAGEVSDNLYNVLGLIADELESDNYSTGATNALLGHFNNIKGRVIQTITEIGSKAAYLDFMSERLGNQHFNYQERQLTLEGVDPAAAIIEFKSQELAYNAALQMGTRIIQPSIFDFMS